MLEAYKKISHAEPETPLQVILTYDERKKSRHRTQTACGKPLGWFLERGQVLADGEGLVTADGTVIKVIAAPESVTEVVSSDPHALIRAAYHLGNRHVALQIGENFLRYQHDHVLDEMVRGLGLEVMHQNKPFDPEPGAYHTSGHAHEHHEHQHH